jgi:hypothetical protein
LHAFDLSDLLYEVAGELEMQGTARRVGIQVDTPPYTMICADRQLLQRSIAQLLTTSLGVSPPGSDVVVTTFRDCDGVELEIASGGAVLIDAASQETAPADRQWPDASWETVWLEARRNMARDGVSISVADCPDGGLAFTLFFPRSRDKSAARRHAA